MKKIKVLFTIIMILLFALSLTACTFRGLSAYEIAVQNGYEGTEAEWLATLKGAAGVDGADGQNFNADYTAYELYTEAVEKGEYSGTFLNFIRDFFASDAVDNTQQAVNKAIFSVVSVTCRFTITTSGRYYYQQTYTATSAGSGVIYSIDKSSGDALIVTNYHVVYNSAANTSNHISDDIKVYLYGNETTSGAISCEFVGGTSQYDLALLKVTGSGVLSSSLAKAATFADSDEIGLGQTVLAIGNPEAEGISVTKGIISVDSETITISDVTGDSNEIRVIRYDASVNPGNSGGGLFNEDGLLIGIVNAKTIDDEVDNMNYAIPANTVSGVVKGLVKYCLTSSNQKLKRAYFGVNVKVNSSIGIYNQEKNRVETVETVTVASVESGAISDGKLKAGDVFVSVSYNGVTKTITRNYQLIENILNLEQGDTIIFKVLRNGVETDVSITVTAAAIVDID